MKYEVFVSLRRRELKYDTIKENSRRYKVRLLTET